MPKRKAKRSLPVGHAHPGVRRKRSSRPDSPRSNSDCDPFSGVDGGDVIGAPRSPGEDPAMPKRKAKRSLPMGHAHPGMRRKRSSRPDSPRSNSDGDPFSGVDGGDVIGAPRSPGEDPAMPKRKAKRSVPLGHAHPGMRRKRSSRPDSPRSNSDGEAQWATPKRKKGKSMVHRSQTKEGSTSVPFQGTDGRDVKAVLHGVPGEATGRSKQQHKHSRRPDRPSSNTDGEARAAGEPWVTPRKKKGKDMVHRDQLKEDSTSVLLLGTEGGDVKAALHGFPGEEETARSKQRHRHSRRTDQPSSNRDGKTQAPGKASAAPSWKKKRNKWLLHNAHLVEDGSTYLMPGSDDIVVMPKQKKNNTDLSDLPASYSCSSGQRAGKASADAENGKNMLMGEKAHKILCPSCLGDVNINKAEGDEPANLIDWINKHDTEVEGEESTVVGNCLDGDLLMDRSIPPAGHSSSKSEESTWTQQKKPNIPDPATGEKVLVDHKQEQGAGQIQDLLDLDEDTAMKQVVSYFRQLGTGPCYDEAFCAKYDELQQIKVYQRLALYRIKDHELLLMGKELDVVELKHKYQPAILQAEGYFKRYEKNLEWYFDPELCMRSSLNDYQRLVISNDGSYDNWDCYQFFYHTYEGDEDYVRYCDEMSNAIKWIDDKVGLDKHQWERYECIAYLQALKIATGYHNIVRDAVMGGFSDYILSLQFDYMERKDFDGVYLEIWKRVAKDKIDFVSAVKELYEQNMFPSRNYDLKLAMENYPFKFRASMKDNYDTYVACIDEKTSEDEAHRLIIEAVKKMVSKPKKTYLDYARKKMEIAARIGLPPKRSSLDITTQGREGEKAKRSLQE